MVEPSPPTGEDDARYGYSVIATMSLLSQDTDEERDDLKTSRSPLLVVNIHGCAVCTLEVVNLSQTVHNRLLTLTKGPPGSDPVFLSV